VLSGIIELIFSIDSSLTDSYVQFVINFDAFILLSLLIPVVDCVEKLVQLQQDVLYRM
jgi:hypothetical protein